MSWCNILVALFLYVITVSVAIKNPPFKEKYKPVNYPSNFQTKLDKKVYYGRRYNPNLSPKNEYNNIQLYENLAVHPRITISPDAELLLPPSSKYYDALLRSLVRVEVAQPLISARTYPYDSPSSESASPSYYSPSSPYSSASTYSSQSSSISFPTQSDDPSSALPYASTADDSPATYSAYSTYPSASYSQPETSYSSYYPSYSDSGHQYGYPSYDSYYSSAPQIPFHPGYVSSGTPHGTLSDQSPAAASHFYSGYGGITSTGAGSDLVPLVNSSRSLYFGNYRPRFYAPLH